MLRRTFIAQSTLAAGAVLVNTGCGTASKPEIKGPAIGLQLYTLRDEIPKGLEPLIEKVSSFGYTHIETYGFEEGLFFKKTPKEFRNILYKNNLVTPSGHYDGNGLLKGNDDVWKKACEAANTLEQEYIIMPYIDEPLRPKDKEGMIKIAKRLNDAGKISKEAGLQFGYHNHDFELKYNAAAQTSLYQVMLEETDPELVKMEMDIYWIYFAEGDAVTIFFQNPKRFPLWHVKDMNPMTRKNIDIGKGTIDYKSIFKYKAESGMKYFFIEQENYDISPLDSIEKSIAYVKKELVS